MQMTVGKKIMLGFGSLIALLAIIGIVITVMVTQTGNYHGTDIRCTLSHRIHFNQGTESFGAIISRP